VRIRFLISEKACQNATYCSVSCQKRHWKQGHKEWCQIPLLASLYNVNVEDVHARLVQTCHLVDPNFKEPPNSPDAAASTSSSRGVGGSDISTVFPTDEDGSHKVVPGSGLAGTFSSNSNDRVWHCASIGSCLAMYEYSILVYHQWVAASCGYPRLMYTLVDPAPTSFQSLTTLEENKERPCLTPQHASSRDMCRLPSPPVMLLFWPDTSSYDMQAILGHAPAALLIIADSFGAAGSPQLHDLIRRWGGKVYSADASEHCQKVMSEFDTVTVDMMEGLHYRAGYEYHVQFECGALPNSKKLRRGTLCSVFYLTHADNWLLTDPRAAHIALASTTERTKMWSEFRKKSELLSDDGETTAWCESDVLAHNQEYMKDQHTKFSHMYPIMGKYKI
jgi:hypothetical protein